MRFRLVESNPGFLESKSITIPVKSPITDVGGAGGDSLAYTMVASAASTPGTATIQIEGGLLASMADAVVIGSALTVSANGSYLLTLDRPSLRYYRVSYAIATGSYTSTLRVLVKGDKAG